MKLPFVSKRNTQKSRYHLESDAFFDELRRKEYACLDEQGHTYLDFTGGNLPARSILDAHHKLIANNVLGNPHSINPTSAESTKLVEAARAKVIEFFNAKDYVCVFTQNASGALKIVGECYPFQNGGQLLLLADNHNSVNGIREYCLGRGGKYAYCPIQYEDLNIDAETLDTQLDSFQETKNKLFAFPAQSNVSGVKHDLGWIAKAQAKGWDVLLDAAAYVPTNRLDLQQVRPDFVSISFYKIFGYPTGIGCLLVRKDKYDKLQKPWFAGGTVTLASVISNHHFLADDHERFEDGTVNYLGIPAIKIGLEYIESVGLERINQRVTSLVKLLIHELNEIKHDNGQPVVKIFGPGGTQGRCGTIIMNLFDTRGKMYPFEQIETMAIDKMISIRSGCFCNPGIDEINNCLTTEELSKYFSSRDSGNYYDMITSLGKMRGATRVSVGVATTTLDIQTFVDFIKEVRDRRVWGPN